MLPLGYNRSSATLRRLPFDNSTMAELRAILDHVRSTISPRRPVGSHDHAAYYAMFHTMYACGLRTCEACGLNSETYGALFKAFSRRSPHARRFDEWSELIASLQARVAPPDVEDAVLGELRACYLEEPGPLWHTVLTLVSEPKVVIKMPRAKFQAYAG